MLQEAGNSKRYKLKEVLGDQQERKDKQDNNFRQKWFAVFSPEETRAMVLSQISYPSKPVDIALFRTSVASKEFCQEKQWRSWSGLFHNIRFYLEHRILEPLKASGNNAYDPESPASNLIYKPVIKILNFQGLPSEAIRSGIEEKEFEVNEGKIDSRKVIIIDRLEQLLTLREILLKEVPENSCQSKTVSDLFDWLIKTFKEIMERREQREKLCRLERKSRKS